MCKDLVIIRIPKTREALQAILKAIKDHTWNKEAVNTWLNDKKTASIHYCDKYASYMIGEPTKEEGKHVWKTFNQVTHNV